MSEPSIDPERIGLKVGIELHRQLKTGRKLFCNCPVGKEEGAIAFTRRLRPSQSEMGEVDPAALFEAKKEGWITYKAGPDFSCLVEADEEPPHDPDPFAVETALIIAELLGSKVVDEIHIMRKMVIDGSNTSGFQRTMIVALGGVLKWPGGVVEEVPIQTITLEEDAARNIAEGQGGRTFSLDRLGVPLIEISLAPITASPRQVQELAMTLARVLKATGRVERGLGAIRQDVNISVMNGAVIEVKGVQQLELISKVVDFEVKRQLWLQQLSTKLKERRLNASDFVKSPLDLTRIFLGTKSRLVSQGLNKGGTVMGVKVPKMKGLLSMEPIQGVRLGKELADIARFYELGGLLHSDELPGMGVTEAEVKRVRNELSCSDEDAFLLLVGDKPRLEECVSALLERLKQSLKGVPAETRAATPQGQTRYLRPRPGSARMYPETDILPIPVSEEMISAAKAKLPVPWEEQVRACASEYKLSLEQAERIIDSDYYELFKQAIRETGVQASVAASILTDTLTAIRREGLDIERISDDNLMELFKMISSGFIAKEAVQLLLETIAKGEADDVNSASSKIGFTTISLDELRKVVDVAIHQNIDLVKQKGEASFSAIMGVVMSQVRGKIDGSVVSSEVRRGIAQAMNDQRSNGEK